jgi:CubicO group peptidase (beta-lactamase class C family)
VRRYVPELRLTDDRAAAQVTVLQLLNHTAGLDWGLIADVGEGDDALAGSVARMAELALIGPPGARTSYSQAGDNLAGRIIEQVTGLTSERAVASLVLEPLGLQHSFLARDDIMTRRFAVGHHRDQDGTLSVARRWRRSRGDNPGGGLASSVADQLGWARFQLGDGRTEGGTRVLPAELLGRMRQPTARLRASTLGDAIGIDGSRLRLEVRMRPELRADADKELPPDYPPLEFGLLPGDADEYVITEGGMKGLRSVFPRDHSGTIAGVDLAGRLFTRVPAASP